jgi:predicted ATPase
LAVATTIARESRAKTLIERVDYFAANTYALRREPEHLRERAEATLEAATDLGNITRRAQSEIWLGWADAEAGDLAGGIARMRRHIDELSAIAAELYVEYDLALIAIALGRMGQFEEGFRTIEESFSLIERSGQLWYEAEMHRVKGELLLAKDASNAAQAEQSFRAAIEIARRQKAKSWELRATTSLAGLLAKQDKRSEARAMLADIYGWFTEGFDTADLKDAKALLDQLGAT